MRLSAALAFLIFAACGRVDYDKLPEGGRFEGQVFLIWLSDGDDEQGRFLFLPNPDDPFRFVRAGAGPYQTVTPGAIYTNGGSIPRLAQVFRGFSPWGYGPAYVIHDWLYHARQCFNAGMGGDLQPGIDTMPFQTSADILGEAIRSLIASHRVTDRDVAPAAITSAVAGPISYRLWTKGTNCEVVPAADLERAYATLPARPKALPKSARIARTPAAGEARLVSTITF